MGKLADDLRAALGLPPDGEPREKSALEKGTSAAVRSAMQLAQRQIYSDMQAASMRDTFNEDAARNETVTETTVTRSRQHKRRIPDYEEPVKTADDYQFVD